MKTKRPKLVLIEGDAGIVGPISRMHLWDRYPANFGWRLYLLVAAKLVLLTSILYYFYG